jgi:hypothetical protein
VSVRFLSRLLLSPESYIISFIADSLIELAQNEKGRIFYKAFQCISYGTVAVTAGVNLKGFAWGLPVGGITFIFEKVMLERFFPNAEPIENDNEDSQSVDEGTTAMNFVATNVCPIIEECFNVLVTRICEHYISKTLHTLCDKTPNKEIVLWKVKIPKDSIDMTAKRLAALISAFRFALIVHRDKSWASRFIMLPGAIANSFLRTPHGIAAPIASHFLFNLLSHLKDNLSKK